MLVRNGLLGGPLICSAFAWSTLALSAETPPAKASPYAFDNLVPNIPGKRMVGVVVDYPPRAKHTAHHHPASAFITAYVLFGAVRSQVDDGPIQTYWTGDSYIERPGAHQLERQRYSLRPPPGHLPARRWREADLHTG